MEDQTTIPAPDLYQAERGIMIRTAREGLAKWQAWLAGGPLNPHDLACCTRWLLEILEAGQECGATPRGGDWPVCSRPAGHQGHHESADCAWAEGSDQWHPRAEGPRP